MQNVVSHNRTRAWPPNVCVWCRIEIADAGPVITTNSSYELDTKVSGKWAIRDV